MGLVRRSVRSIQRAVAAVLDDHEDIDPLYPNRFYTLLSADPSRSVNTSTLEALELALPELGGGVKDNADLREKVQLAFDAVSAQGNGEEHDLIAEAADRVGVPNAVVLYLLRKNGHTEKSKSTPEEREGRKESGQVPPDWSFQDDAFESCLASLRKDPNRKVGLVVPTGGGKTRIAERIGLEWLDQDERDDSIVMWVTHRHHLRRQARRELQRTLNANPDQIPEGGAGLLEERVRFVMVHDVEEVLQEEKENIALIVVDEAHHAAAPSYQSILETTPLRGLFLTATPNRRDGLPIGIDEIAYTITYRELFERGVIVEPVFEEPLTIEGLDWENPRHLADLADYLLDRTEADLRKPLVAVTRTDAAEALYEALAQQLDGLPGHPLEANDIGYVYGSASSSGAQPQEFLDEFSARPRGILVATSQLVGEGFDDPSIDSAVITYPSTSISHLMQVAGRAMRWAPGKEKAHIIQVRSSKLAYHFEQRWLYQDISDSLRPRLEDISYTSKADFERQLEETLELHHVSEAVRERIMQQVEGAEEGARYNLLLTGIPFYGEPDSFDEAKWGAILVGPEERPRFLRVFNDFCACDASVHMKQDFLKNYIEVNKAAGSLWKSYVDMLEAMEYAYKEIHNEPYSSEGSRGYVPNQGTTWLKYVTLKFEPVLPPELEAFLEDAYNRKAVARDYERNPEAWALAVKVPTPMTGTWAYLLNSEQAEWLLQERDELISHLADVAPEEMFLEAEGWRQGLTQVPVPHRLMANIERLLSRERFERRSLEL